MKSAGAIHSGTLVKEVSYFFLAAFLAAFLAPFFAPFLAVFLAAFFLATVRPSVQR